jgi:hypothetical protein
MVETEKHEVQPEILKVKVVIQKKVKVVSAYQTQSGTLITASPCTTYIGSSSML